MNTFFYVSTMVIYAVSILIVFSITGKIVGSFVPEHMALFGFLPVFLRFIGLAFALLVIFAGCEPRGGVQGQKDSLSYMSLGYWDPRNNRPLRRFNVTYFGIALCMVFSSVYIPLLLTESARGHLDNYVLEFAIGLTVFAMVTFCTGFYFFFTKCYSKINYDLEEK